MLRLTPCALRFTPHGKEGADEISERVKSERFQQRPYGPMDRAR